MDRSVAPGDDFYRFANGGWIKGHPLRPDETERDAFGEIYETVEVQIRDLVTGIAARDNGEGTEAQKIGDLYNLYMDTERLDREGGAPLRPQLEKIAAIKSKDELAGVLAWMYTIRVAPFFTAGVGADFKDSSSSIFMIMQGGYGLDNKDYYFNDDERSLSVRGAYTRRAARFFVLTGSSETEARRAAETVVAIEARLLSAARSNVENMDYAAQYNKVTIAELSRLAPVINWKEYFSSLGLPGIREVNVNQREFLQNAASVIAETPLEDLKAYLRFKMIESAAPVLSKEFSEANLEIINVLSGVETFPERQKTAIALIGGALPDVVGKLYVEKYFPPESKERVTALVKNLQDVLAERIKRVPWMGDETKAAALKKLASFRINVGYPDEWEDYSALVIDRNLSFWENALRIKVFNTAVLISQYYEPIDKGAWTVTPQTVNAFNNWQRNSLNFPAAILQPPFFFPEGDDAVNYGAIGHIIGHEMTHGFDSIGRHFDKDGNLSDWWTEEDAARFDELAGVFVDYFDSLEVLDGLHVNGALTLAENIADSGGLAIAYEAWKKSLGKKEPPLIGGWTGEQRFFLAAARCNVQNIRDEALYESLFSDPHSPKIWRINGTLPHMDGWYGAFNVGRENKLYIPPEMRIKPIW